MNGSTPKKPRGCFFYGCITGLVLLLIMVVGLLLGILVFKRMLTNYTDTKPVPLPVAQLSPAEAAKLHERIDNFNKALKEHRATQPLELTADDINGWIATSPGAQSLTGRVYVTIEGKEFRGQISVPMEKLRLAVFRGRYLNGSATFNVSMSNGFLHVIVPEITVKGRPLPSLYMDQIRQIDWAQGTADDPNTKSELERYDEIKIENGKLIIVPKKPESDTGPPKDEKKPETESVK